MSYGITFYNRDFTRRVQPAVMMVVDRLQWLSAGGPSLAEASAFGEKRELLSLVELLRCPVSVWNNQADSVWWGYLESVTVDGITVGLAEMANRVQAGYTFTVDTGGIFSTIRAYTSIVEDLGSQGDYGIKERILAAGGVSVQRATSLRDQALAQHARPAPSISLNVTSNSPSGARSSPGAHLTFKGWFSTLGWRYYSNAKGYEGYTTEGVGVQVIGDQIADTYLAQKFSCPTNGWDLDTLYMKCGKFGNPGDALSFAIQGDNAGSPNGASQATGLVSAAAIGLDYSWTKVTLSPVLTLGAGTYWITVARSGALDAANFYKFKVNEALGYPRGAMKIYNGGAWVARSPAAAMNFSLQGKEETTLQIADIGVTAACGQFLTAVRIEDGSFLYQTPFRDGLKTGLQEITSLLASGTSSGAGLLAEVSKERVLRVYQRGSTVQAWLGEDRIIRDAWGQRMQESLIINKLLKIEKPGLEMADIQFVARVEANGQGIISLK